MNDLALSAAPLRAANAPADLAQRFSLVHAVTMLAALLLALTSGRSWPIPVFAAISLARFVSWSRDSFAARGFGPANWVTSVRALALLGLAHGFDQRVPLLAAGWSLAIFSLDGVDGHLARRTGRVSDFGAHFDMEVDGCYVLLLACGLFELRLAGAWVLIPGLLRYALVLARRFAARPSVPARTRIGRWSFSILVVGFTCCVWPLGQYSAFIAGVATVVIGYSFLRSFQALFAGGFRWLR
jgi:phosphatidylglycerophosphate synthase